MTIKVEVCRDVKPCSVVLKGTCKSDPLQTHSGPEGSRN